jgi:hypothetical protein
MQYVALQDLVTRLRYEVGSFRCNLHENYNCGEICACGHPCSKHVSFGGWDEHGNREHDMCLEHGCQCFKFRSMVSACKKLVGGVVGDRVVDILRRQPKTSRKPLQRKPTVLERYWTTNEVADMLGMSSGAVRVRAQRVARMEEGKIVSRIGPGVIGYKFGRTWRFKVTVV